MLKLKKLMVSAASIFFLCAIAASAQANPLPIEDFASLPAVKGVKLSSDGTKILSLVRVDTADKKGTAIAIYDTETKKQSYPLFAENMKYKIRKALWANNDKILVSAIFPAMRYGTPVQETRLLILDIHTKELRNALPKRVLKKLEYMPQFQDSIVDLLPDDKDHFLLELDGFEGPNVTNIYKVSLVKSKAKMIKGINKDASDWMTDRQHNIRIGRFFDDATYKYYHRNLKGKWETLFKFDSFSKEQVWPMGFSENPNELYVKALHEGYDAIFKIDLNDPQRTKKLVYAKKGRDVSGRLFYSKKAKKVVGLKRSDGVSFFDPEYEALYNAIDKGLSDYRNSLYSLTDDERRYIVFSSNDRESGIYFLGDRDKKTLEPIAYRYANLEPSVLVEKKRISYNARDGLEIQGFVSLPKSYKKGEPVPTVIFPHGGPISYNGNGFDYWTQFFANRGYAVLQMNFRGSSGYGFDFMKSGLQNWGLAMQDDVEDGARWMIEQGYAKPDKICIVGASYGGYAALMGSVKTPDLYQCAVSFAGVSDVNLLVRRSWSYVNSDVVEKQIGKAGRSLKDRSPVNFANKINVPVLLIHGTDDRSVRVEQSKKMYKRLKKAKKSVNYIELKGGDHYLSNNDHRMQTFKAMEAFLAQHLN